MLRVGVVGGSGYAGVELLRLLAGHPLVRVVAVSSRTHAGKQLGAVLPGLRGIYDLPFTDASAPTLASEMGCDVIFTATPHGVALEAARGVLEAGSKLIDLGADFRFHDTETYEHFYGLKHTARDIMLSAVYGLPELHRDEIALAKVVGSPGCYPTSAVLACVPLIEAGLVETGDIVIDSKSGTSGAGSTPSPMHHFAECNDNFRAYGVGHHRHTPEIEQELSEAARTALTVCFTPHLVPMTRGILTTAYFRLMPSARDACTADVLSAFAKRYTGEFFVRLLGADELPQTRAVMGSNFVELTARVDGRTGRVIVICAIDNLVKGASGQAVQSMNIMFGLEETLGLRLAGICP